MTEKRKYPWEEVILADDPVTIVDRLNGIYPSAVGQYAVSPLQKEAAREIEFLHNMIAKLGIDLDKYRPNQS